MQEPEMAGKDAMGAQHAPSAPSNPRSRADCEALWPRFQEALRDVVQHEQFETWFRRAELRAIDDHKILLAVQNQFTRDWLSSHYAGAIEQAARASLGSAGAVEIEVDPELTVSAAAPAPAADSPQESPAQALAPSSRGPIGKLMRASDVDLNPHYRFDNFVVGPCNRFAHAASVGVSESPGKAYNPFFLHGSVGLGKTHLLQSLCYELLGRSNEMRILYLSCETFVNHFISALGNGDLDSFRNKYRNVDVLVVDDIHLLANKERTQEEFFHTFNALYNASKQIVLSSDVSPKEIPTLHDRLVSRFKWGLVTEIEPACYETRVAVLKRKSCERGHELPDDVAALIAEHVDTNIRELEGAVTRVLGFASLNGQAVTTDLARSVLRDVFHVRKGQPSMDDILRVVTTHFSVKLSELQSKKRTKAIAFPRQIGMYLVRKVTRHSLEDIGGFFGGRDHSTVLYGIERIDTQMKRDANLRDLVASFLGQLQRPSF